MENKMENICTDCGDVITGNVYEVEDKELCDVCYEADKEYDSEFGGCPCGSGREYSKCCQNACHPL